MESDGFKTTHPVRLTTAKKESVLVQTLSGILESYRESSSHHLPSSDSSSARRNSSEYSKERLDSRSQSFQSQRTSSFSLAVKPSNVGKSSKAASQSTPKMPQKEAEKKKLGNKTN